MSRLFLQAFGIIVLFAGLWLTIGRFDWVTILKVEQKTESTEEKFGELLWDFMQTGNTVIEDPYVLQTMDSILSRICESNDIDQSEIKLHLLDKSEVNAFALPDNHLVIFSGLIMDAENAEEVSGVIGHEIAHMVKRHVMKKLIKEIGLSTIVTMVGGTHGGEILGEAARLLSSSAYDRKLEREADIAAVDYLLNAEIDPEPMANFMYRLADEQPDEMRYVSWLSTHPDSRERAEYIIEYSQNSEVDFRPVLSDGSWKLLQEKLANQQIF